VWARNDLTRRLGIDWPIVQAPMAGGISTPALAAAVSNTGALGSFAAGYLAPGAVRDAVREIRRLTSRPFAVGFFAPEEAPAPSAGEVARAAASLRPFRDELGLGPPGPPAGLPALREQLEAALEAGFPVLSFTFGLLPRDALARARAAGVEVVLGTATTPEEAALLEASGADAVVAQGAEAGGHRGTFAGPAERALLGTVALVPRVAARVRLPVVAAGGISDGRGVAAALVLGASAAQLGTAFLACPESGAGPAYRAAVASASDGDRTALTRSFTGRAARGLRNRFVERMEGAPVLPYPLQNSLTQDLRQAAARAGKADLLSLWAGQGAPPRAGVGAGELVAALAREAGAALDALR
jgi:nitronate monooxygenase